MGVRLPTEVPLEEGEIPIWFGQASWASQWKILLIAGFFAIFGFFSLLSSFAMPAYAIGGMLMVTIIFFGIPVLLCLAAAWIRVTQSEYFVSNKRVFAKYGLISRVANDIKMDWITNTTISQDFVGRILGFGNVVIASPGTGTGAEPMVGVSDPMRIKSMIDQRLSHFKKSKEIDDSMRRVRDEFKMGRLDEERYNSLMREFESEAQKYS